jgi:hypothetical protein
MEAVANVGLVGEKPVRTGKHRFTSGIRERDVAPKLRREKPANRVGTRPPWLALSAACRIIGPALFELPEQPSSRRRAVSVSKVLISAAPNAHPSAAPVGS